MNQITLKQTQFLEGIRHLAEVHSRFPNYREMMGYFGYKSPNSATQNLDALRAKGYIRKTRYGWRFAENGGCTTCPTCGQRITSPRRVAA